MLENKFYWYTNEVCPEIEFWTVIVIIGPKIIL